MTFSVEEVVERLADAGVRLDRGLTEADVKRIEQKFGFAFGSDHRALLRAALPLGDAWLNWRHATPARIKERLRAPIESVIADVMDGGVWPAPWGPRPDDAEAAEQAARTRLAAVAVLVPLYGHCYLPAGPAPAGSPVVSVRRGAVRIYPGGLLGYVDVEFGSEVRPGPAVATRPERPLTGLPEELAFWAELAASSESADQARR